MKPSAIRAAVIRALAQVTDRSVEGIADTDHLVEDLGVDSMACANLLLAIEEHLGMRMPDGTESCLVETRDVGDLVMRLTAIHVAASDGALASCSEPVAG
jgi:acyl carrier protein